MCDTHRLADDREIDAAGLARRTQLQQWLLEGLSVALERWRDELVTRLPSERPLPLRLPHIFEPHLKTDRRRVVILAGDEVRVLLKWHRREKRAEVGDVVVPTRFQLLTVWGACTD